MVTIIPTPIEVPNDVRFARAALRQRIREHPSRVDSMAVCADVLSERHHCLRNALLWDVLLWCYRTDTPTVQRLLRHARIIDMYRPVGKLTDRQIRALCYALRSRSHIGSGGRVA